jgi:hypothetical protein
MKRGRKKKEEEEDRHNTVEVEREESLLSIRDRGFHPVY